MSHKNEENSVIDAFLGLDISSLISADVETLANPDLEHWEAALPVYGYGSPGTNINEVKVVHEATGGLWMENKSDVKDDLNFWRQTSPDNKFRCHSSSELSPFSNMGDSCHVEKIGQDDSFFQQTEEEGILGLRGLRKMSESLEDGKDGVYYEKDIAKKYEEEQPNIVKNIEHLLEDEEFDEAKTNLDEVKLDMPEEWNSPFPSPPACETDENGQAFCFSPQTSHNSLLYSDSPCFSSPPFSPYNNSISLSHPSCFYSPSPSPYNSLVLTSDHSCLSSPCSSPHLPSYSQPISGYSSPVKDQSGHYSASPTPLSRSEPPFSSCPLPPACRRVPLRSSQLLEQCGSNPGQLIQQRGSHPGQLVQQCGTRPGQLLQQRGTRPGQLVQQHGTRPGQHLEPCGSRPVDICEPTAAKLKRNVDFPVYVHPNTVPKKENIPTNYAAATKLDNHTRSAPAPKLEIPKSYVTTPRLDIPKSYVTTPRLDIPKSYATAARRSRTIPRLNCSKNLPVKAQICGFCRQNGERKEIFRSHNKADENGVVTCPYLASHVCEICGATGQNAHTKTYCPKLPKKQVPLPVALKNTKRKSDGKLRK